MIADIERLSIAERIQLVEDIWDSIASAPEELPIPQAQRDELDRRLQAHHDNPQEGDSWKIVQSRIKSK
ncbi:MAG TPA: addiction module protein [Chthonomonadaceae bacterium]|nr:addiction module protein [Chthonomonadaceae bacterium]